MKNQLLLIQHCVLKERFYDGVREIKHTTKQRQNDRRAKRKNRALETDSRKERVTK